MGPRLAMCVAVQADNASFQVPGWHGKEQKQAETGSRRVRPNTQPRRSSNWQSTGGQAPELGLFTEESQSTNVDWICHADNNSETVSSIDLNIDRVPVLLTNGLSAMAPLDVLGRDEVVVFVGAKTPFILRQNESRVVVHQPMLWSETAMSQTMRL
ncbi:hypothetical protein CC86DRAFT_386695 [Ophiobolus disseminans]|uniref:Uncharacterized protein n=1 Tax=Ophiobolus disseminans TaxID=1469910 RepID=A0A6A6ZKH9_9PLEO|nr:hypothetical protein CC86DRAFT_386695 [Ophiobolus disseminans]